MIPKLHLSTGIANVAVAYILFFLVLFSKSILILLHNHLNFLSYINVPHSGSLLHPNTDMLSTTLP